MTVGRPCAGLPGNDVTHFSSACPPPSAGIARKSPAGYAGTYTFGGIVHSPLAYATNASRTASSARSGDTAASTCARLNTGIAIGKERSLRAVAAIEIRDLRVVRGERVVLPGLSLEVAAGRVTGLLGPSGCGKSTLMRAIVGVQIVAGGSVTRPRRAGGLAAAAPPRRRT